MPLGPSEAAHGHSHRRSDPYHAWRSAYEYEEVGRPFLARLCRAVYEHERQRERPRRLDLSRFLAPRASTDERTTRPAP